jgi:hypothetical protein
MASVDVKDISILSLTVCDISVTIDFKPLTEIQNNLIGCIKITRSFREVTNLTSKNNKARIAPELLCRADVSSLVTSVLCLRTVGSMAYTGNSSNRTNYLRLSPGEQENFDFSLTIGRPHY